MNYLKKRAQAIGHALNGWRSSFQVEAHLKLQVMISAAVIVFAGYCSITRTEWFMILACITLVLCLEMVNSALEKLCDLVDPKPHPTVKYVKDVAAGAVLLACCFSVGTGILVFMKYFIRSF